MKHLFLFFFLLFLIPTASAIIIGVAPSEINFGKAEAGSTYTATFTVFYPDAEKSKFNITASKSPEWFSFSRLDSGANKTRFEMSLSLPENAPGGGYSILVYAKPSESGSSDGSGAARISILPAVAIPVKFSIEGGQDITAAPSSQPAKAGAEASNDTENTGNIPAVENKSKSPEVRDATTIPDGDDENKEKTDTGSSITGGLSMKDAAGYSTIILGAFAILVFAYLWRRR